MPLEITYPGANNKTEITYSPMEGIAKIVEIVSGSVASTKQFPGGEERDGNGAVTKQFFAQGQRNGSNNYFYGRDNIGSVRSMSDNAGVSVSDRAFDPYGRTTVISETVSPDFGFAGMYIHSRSGLNLTIFRAYSESLARWISRDPLGEDASINAYGYVDNNPIGFVDKLGLFTFNAKACAEIEKELKFMADMSRETGREIGQTFNIGQDGMPEFMLGPPYIGSSSTSVDLPSWTSGVALTHVIGDPGPLGFLNVPIWDNSGFNAADYNYSLNSPQQIWTINASGNLFVMERGHLYQIDAGCKKCDYRGPGPKGNQFTPIRR